MLRNLFRRREKSKSVEEVAVEAVVPDFIPYAIHYDKDTILTKNGELLQIVKIIGFASEMVGSHYMDLRETIRQSVIDHVGSDDYALWFHTVRRKKSLDPGGNYTSGFSLALNREWKAKHNWNQKYVNELYVTVIHDGFRIKFADPKQFIQSFSANTVFKVHQESFAKAKADLDKVVQGMLSVLGGFGARRLSMVKWSGEYYSEPLQFFSKILNLLEKPMVAPVDDIARYLATHRIAFGFNTMEVQGEGIKRFGSIFSIKEYHELSTETLDQFLQMNQEFIITQTVNFINQKQALKLFERQNYIAGVSKSSEFSDAIGLKDIADSNQGRPTDYGQGKIMVMFIAENLEDLEKNITEGINTLNDIGILAVRMDLLLEESFWSQLPANFNFLSRQRPINTRRVGGFGSLYNFPAGQQMGNHWGSAVTIFYTAHGTPYFFNFHQGDNGHTVIIGPRGSGKTVLLNFLVSEARKFNGKLFFFDQLRASKVFIKAIGGYYSLIKPLEPSLEYAFNPLAIPDTPENRLFLVKWLIYLAIADGKPVNDAEKDLLRNIVNQLFQLPREQRRLSHISPWFGEVTPGSLAERMAKWHSGGQYAHLFDNPVTAIVPFNELAICGFGMSHVINNKVTLGPIFSYMMHRVEMALDGTPTMVIMDEAWNLVNNPLFAPYLASWLDRLKAKNAMVIFAAEDIDNASKSEITGALVERIATQVFMPNPRAEQSSVAYQQVWGLSDDEFVTLKEMTSKRGQFMLRQGGQSVVASLDLHGMKEVRVLSGGDETVKIMREAVVQKGDKPDEWLPLFYDLAEKQA